MNFRRSLIYVALIFLGCNFAILLVSTIRSYRELTADSTKYKGEYLDNIFDTYKSEITGDILIGNEAITKSLLKEISDTKLVGIQFNGPFEFDSKLTAIRLLNRHYILSFQNKNVGDLILSVPENSLGAILAQAAPSAAVQALLIVFGFFAGWVLLRRQVFAPLQRLSSNISNGTGSKDEFRESPSEVREIANSYYDMRNKLEDSARFEAISKIAMQVSHDIRSPLTALNFAASRLSTTDESVRTLLLSAAKRIDNTANNLLSLHRQYKKDRPKYQTEVRIPVKAHVLKIAREKRLTSPSIRINLSLAKEEIFVRVSPTDFDALLSNLMNNSIEAFTDPTTGTIDVDVRELNNYCALSVSDNGGGIPEDILIRLNDAPFTYNKPIGNGIGLSHAKNTVESAGGRLTIDSDFGRGTTVKVRLPRAEAPRWYTNDIRITGIKSIICLDDDPAIHEVWRRRFEETRLKSCIMHFYKGTDVLEYLKQNKIVSHEVLVLTDFDLNDVNANGLMVIKHLDSNIMAYLITSYFEDETILEFCQDKDVKVIPKQFIEDIQLID